MYRSLVGRLSEYPIPTLRFQPESPRERLLDIGCNWGRWVVAASRQGFRPVGIDRSLSAVNAARRVAAQLGAAAHFVVADARHLPFRSGSIDATFSYSVLQHMEKSDARLAMREASRVLRSGGRAVVQMPNGLGLRSLYHQARRSFRRARGNEVRYWHPAELRQAFEADIGPSTLSVDGYLSLNAQPTDRHLLPRRFRWVVDVSEALRQISGRVRWLADLADSLYVTSRKTPASPTDHAHRLL